MTDELQKRLRAKAKVWATNITQYANANLGNKSDLIGVTSKTVENQGKITIEVTARNKKTRNPWGLVRVARAYEYGSGIHGKRHVKYQIKPRLKKILAFYWETATANPDNFVFDDQGRVLLPSVNHPGVQAVRGGQGYMAPAIKKVRAQMRKEIPNEIRKEVIGAFRRGFKQK